MSDREGLAKDIGKLEVITGQHGEALSSHKERLRSLEDKADANRRETDDQIDKAISEYDHHLQDKRLNDRNGIMADTDNRRDDAQKSFVSTQFPVLFGQQVEGRQLVTKEELPSLIEDVLANRRAELKKTWRNNFKLFSAFAGVVILIVGFWNWINVQWVNLWTR